MLSRAEQAWIAAHPVVTVGLDAGNAPLNFCQADGAYAGISVDYLRLLADKIGVQLDLRGSTWNEALGKAMAHEVDALLSASYKEERRVALDFTAPYCETPLAMVTRADHPAIDQIADFAGQRVAVVSGSVRVGLLKEQVPTCTLSEVADAGAGLRALAEGKVDAFFDDLPVIQTQVSAMMLSQVRVALLYFQPEAGAQRIAVRNDAPLLLAMFDRAIAQLTPDEHRAIRERWLHLADGAPVQHDLGLTASERQWLANHPVIRVGCDPNWAPIEWRDSAGTWRGLSIDYLERLQRMLGVRFVIDPAATWQETLEHARDGRIDLFSSVSETDERRRDWLFTEPYISFPITIFARRELGFVRGLDELKNARAAVIAGRAEESLISQRYPGLALERCASLKEGLERVRQGVAQAYVGGLLPTAHALQDNGDLSIQVVGETPFAYRQTFAVRRDWPEFAEILRKALRAIPQEQRDDWWRRWVSLNYQTAPDYSLWWKLGGPVLALLVAFLSWNRRLRAEITRRTVAEGELIAYRDRLEHLVRERTADLEFALGRLRRLGAAIDQTTEAVVLAAPDGQIEFVNPAFARMTGIAAESASALDLAAIGLPWSDSALRRGEWHGRVKAHREDGVEYEFEAVVSAVTDQDGALIDLLAVLRDITASRQIEERLAQSQKLEAVGTLAGGIAHDFNNILAAILGSAELAERPGVSAERRSAYLARIITASNRARQLVQQILAFSRGNQGARRPVELAPIIVEALELLRASLPSTIQFERRLAPDAVVLGDATRIHQIVMNLGTNAGLAMPDGGVLRVVVEEIELDPVSATQLGMAPGPTVRMMVVDTGVGMTRSVMSRIFEPFFTTRAQGQGTGLGLAVVHGLIRDMHGAVNVTSEVGQGTTFTIYLPRCLAGTEPVTSSALPAVTGNGERILFVDDEPALRHNAADMLNALGYRTMVAANGPEALALLRQDPGEFDLLITDATMPYMTGIDLIVAARQLAPQLRMILCSGQSDPGSGNRPADVAFLAKPITSRELVSAIRKSFQVAAN